MGKKILHLICNSHIDPVWQWDWDEGASAALSTFYAACNLLDKYDREFMELLYKNLFRYMLSECLVKHSVTLTEQNKQDLRDLLSRACKLIEQDYLPDDYKTLCGYLSCLK